MILFLEQKIYFPGYLFLYILKIQQIKNTNAFSIKITNIFKNPTENL